MYLILITIWLALPNLKYDKHCLQLCSYPLTAKYMDYVNSIYIEVFLWSNFYCNIKDWGWYGMSNSATDSKLDVEETFMETMRQFQLERAPVVEKEYYQEHGDGYNQNIRNELYDRIIRLLGINKNLMIEFADRDAACYNPNTDYFYNQGFSDCLIFLQTFKGTTNNSIENVLNFANMN